MNLKEIAEWSKEGLKLSNAELIKNGVNDRELHNVKNYFKMLIDRADRIIADRIRNERWENDMSKFLLELQKLGVQIPQEKKKEDLLVPSESELDEI